jgi:hypothetical protein
VIPFEGSGPDPEVSIKEAHGSFRTAYPNRIVNNIYFDTPDLRLLRDHVNGQYRRTKIRIRWYGESSPAVVENAQLELKHKEGDTGTKEVYELAPMPRGLLMSGDGISRWLIRSDLPPELRASVLACVPTLFNRYQRSYYATTFGRIRATLDRGISFQPFPRWVRVGVAMSRRSPIRVLEVKYAASVAAEASRVLGSLPYRISQSSKYILGLSTIQGASL